MYRWLDPTHARSIGNAQQLQSLPAIETKKKWTRKTKPGISTFAQKLGQVGPDHLEKLFAKARKIVPQQEAERTPIFLLATAGMRLLPTDQREAVLEEVCAYARKTTPFLLPDCEIHVRVIPGDVEGLYGWTAANYLLGGFDPRPASIETTHHATFGFLDMGGASAQIAFAPNATEAERHANDLTMIRLRSIDGNPAEHKIFTTTWLGFGVNEARRRYVETLEATKDTKATKELLDPCLPSGLETDPKGDVFLPDSKTIDGKTPILKGIGKFDQCLNKTLPLLDKGHICEDEPCLLGGVHVPAIDFDVNHFVGVSEYWHTTHDIFQFGEKDKAYDFNTYQNRVSKFCSQNWSDIRAGIDEHQWGDKVDEKTAVEVCFKASWLINILHEGIGIPRVGLEETPDAKHNGTSKLINGAKDKGFEPTFRPINKIDDVEVSWTLGKIILYASSQIPPATNGILPVGFGSNVPGVPDDFQYPSVQLASSNATVELPLPEDAPSNPTTSILRAGSSRRIPGIILFLLILVFAIYFLLGRRRRSRMPLDISSQKHLGPSRGSSRAFFAGKLPNFFSSSPNHGKYERVDLEDGGNGMPNNFELSGLDEESSDSSTGSNAGKTSGWATPRSRSNGGYVPTSGSFEDLGSGHGLGLGLSSNKPSPMERSGLTGRTESRDRLLGMGEGKRSRLGSPQRGSAVKLGRLVED